MPPTQKVAATRWIQTRIMLNRVTSGIVAGLLDPHHIKMYPNSEEWAKEKPQPRTGGNIPGST
jgi:hypothetical protein